MTIIISIAFILLPWIIYWHFFTKDRKAYFEEVKTYEFSKRITIFSLFLEIMIILGIFSRKYSSIESLELLLLLLIPGIRLLYEFILSSIYELIGYYPYKKFNTQKVHYKYDLIYGCNSLTALICLIITISVLVFWH